jgi:hypothetical protein
VEIITVKSYYQKEGMHSGGKRWRKKGKRWREKMLCNGSPMQAEGSSAIRQKDGRKQETNLYSRPTITAPARTNNQLIDNRAPRKQKIRRRTRSVEMGEQMADDVVSV